MRRGREPLLSTGEEESGVKGKSEECNKERVR